ncbi:MAG: haloacid dehalogenase type II [Pseudomonadota bacterium]
MHSVFAFDAYGTLFDVHAAVRRHADAIGPDSAALSETWRQKQLEYSWIHGLMGRYVSFWELTQNALDFAFAKFPNANRGTRQALLDAYFELECYPEVPAVLKALKDAGCETAILSNGSTDMLNAAVQSAGLDDLVDSALSVDLVQKFKTDEAVYQLVLDTFSATPEQVSFQSSNRWDVAAASGFGFRTLWINRTNQPDEYKSLAPSAVLEDLTALIGPQGRPV